MNYQLAYDVETHLIRGRIEGELQPGLVENMAREFAALVKKHNCFKLLNDLRAATITLSAFDIYRMPRLVDRSGVPITCRRALVAAGSLKDFTFLETASLNFGQQVRIFTDIDEAVHWLQKDK